MPDNFKSLGEIFGTAPEFKDIREKMLEQQVIDSFYDIFPELRNHAIPVSVKKKALTLSVENAVLRGDLKHHDSEVIGKINRYFDEVRITRLKFGQEIITKDDE